MPCDVFLFEFVLHLCVQKFYVGKFDTQTAGSGSMSAEMLHNNAAGLNVNVAARLITDVNLLVRMIIVLLYLQTVLIFVLVCKDLQCFMCCDVLQKEHNEILAKLNFVLALSECVVELAQARGMPLAALTESTGGRQQTEGSRRAEQLVLLVRALKLLSSGLNLATQQLRAGRLQPSASVKGGKCGVHCAPIHQRCTAKRV
jgi:hypothetical protein